jgi:hypothetical protein
MKTIKPVYPTPTPEQMKMLNPWLGSAPDCRTQMYGNNAPKQGVKHILDNQSAFKPYKPFSDINEIGSKDSLVVMEYTHKRE